MFTQIQNWSRRYLGEFIIAGAALHSIAGLLSPDGSIADLVREGWFGSMNPGYDPASGETFWFTFTGLALFTTGLLVRSHLRATGTLPAAFGWGLTIIALLIGTAMPASGAWLILLVGLLALAVSRPVTRANSSHAASTP